MVVALGCIRQLLIASRSVAGYLERQRPALPLQRIMETACAFTKMTTFMGMNSAIGPVNKSRI